MKSSALKYCAGMAGDASPAAQCPTLKFITNNSAATQVTILSKT
jgi:hypothetical protein